MERRSAIRRKAKLRRVPKVAQRDPRSPIFARYHQQCIAGSAVDPVVLEVDVYAHVVGAISPIQS